MRSLSKLVLAAALAAAVLRPMGASAQSSSDSAAAAQALFGQLFAHAFVTQNALAVDTAWPGIESALRRQRPDLDATVVADLRREFERIRLARLAEITKDVPDIYARHLTAEDMRVLAAFYSTATGIKMLQTLPKILPEAFALVLPRMQVLSGETQEAFIKVLRERGILH
jgi:uncharacterized protein